MILEGALLKVRHEIEEMRCQPGSQFEVPVEIVRSSLLATEVQVDLELPKSWQAWVSCDSVRLAPGSDPRNPEGSYDTGVSVAWYGSCHDSSNRHAGGTLAGEVDHGCEYRIRVVGGSILDPTSWGEIAGVRRESA